MMLRLCLALVVLLSSLLAPAAVGGAQASASGRPAASNAEFRSNTLLVRIAPDARPRVRTGSPTATGIPGLDRANRANGVVGFERLAKPGQAAKADADLFGWYVVTLPGPGEKVKGRLDVGGRMVSSDSRAKGIASLADAYRRDPSVQAVDLNWVVTADATPTDPYYASSATWGQSYPDLWGIRKLNPEGAWNTTTGSAAIVVADVDTGIDRNHPDLSQNMWVNADEIPGNGLDDDKNGYVDDYYGWNWVSNTNDPMDDNGHGTHTAGTIGAVGNNGQGVVGVNWTTRLMALKFLNSSGSGSLDAGILALQYAADNGARVASNSWGCQCQSPALDDAVRYAHDKGVVVVAAAGNSNIDALDFSPASADGAITVAASDASDLKASFSNWGEKVDVAAPGVDILSTKSSLSQICTSAVVGTYYCRLSGTSMATPHVSGLAALLLSANPSLSVEQVRQLLRKGSVDVGAAGKDSSFGYGRIAADTTIGLAKSGPLAPVIASPRSRSLVYGSSVAVTGSVGGAISSYRVEVGAGRAPTSWTTVVSSPQAPAGGTLATIDTTRLAEGPNIIRLTATDTSGKTYQYQVNDVEVDNFDAAISMPRTLVAKGSVEVVGTAKTKNGLTFAGYTLEWGAGANPTSWSTASISLQGGGNSQVTDSTLGRWDSSGLTAGQQYSLRLTVYAAGGVSASTVSVLNADADLVPGWPRTVSLGSSLGTLPSSVPALGDLDGDGFAEVVVPEPSGAVRGFERDGTPIWTASTGAGWYPNMPASVADLDGDGRAEVIVSATNGASLRKIVVLRGDGTAYPGWTPPQAADGSLADDTPALADLDADGRSELVYADRNGQLHAARLSGGEVAGFPRAVFPSTSSSIRPSLAISDLDKDGKPEILLVTQGEIYALDSSGAKLPGWPIAAPSYGGQALAFAAAATAGNVDGDGKLEVFALTSVAGCGGCSAYVYGWTSAGAALAGWPRTVGTLPYNSVTRGGLSVADFDADGLDEVVAATSGVYFLGASGLEKSGGSGASAPALADLDADGKVEVAAGYGSAVNVVDDTGAVLWSRTLPTTTQSGNAFTIPLLLGDVDSDGYPELVATWSPFTTMSGTAYVFVWKLRLSATPAMAAAGHAEWPMFGHDAARDGRLAGGGVTPPPSGSPTATPVPPTATPVPPTSTPVPTGTVVPPTPTNTPVPPTSTPMPTSTPAPTRTPVPPTPTKTPVPPTATPAPVAGIHVGGLSGTSAKSGKNWKASVTILVHDASHSPAAGVVVTGVYTANGAVGKALSCTTTTAGTCSLTSSSYSASVPSVVFTVSRVALGGTSYIQSLSNDVGTTITIFKP